MFVIIIICFGDIVISIIATPAKYNPKVSIKHSSKENDTTHLSYIDRRNIITNYIFTTPINIFMPLIQSTLLKHLLIFTLVLSLNWLKTQKSKLLTLSLPLTRICVNISTVYNDTLVAKGLNRNFWIFPVRWTLKNNTQLINYSYSDV